jgi:hypothetical protein
MSARWIAIHSCVPATQRTRRVEFSAGVLQSTASCIRRHAPVYSKAPVLDCNIEILDCNTPSGSLGGARRSFSGTRPSFAPHPPVIARPPSDIAIHAGRRERLRPSRGKHPPAVPARRTPPPTPLACHSPWSAGAPPAGALAGSVPLATPALHSPFARSDHESRSIRIEHLRPQNGHASAFQGLSAVTFAFSYSLVSRETTVSP